MVRKFNDSSERLFKTNTVNSLQRQKCDTKQSVDSLDLTLSSVYNHESDLFVQKCNTILQLENAKFNPIKEKLIQDMNAFRRNYIHHPLIIGNLIQYNLHICKKK